MTSPETLRPSMTKPASDGIIDNKKPAHVRVIEYILYKNKLNLIFFFKKKYVSEWEIRPEDLLNRGRMVGRGTYGTVYKAEVRLHGMKK